MGWFQQKPLTPEQIQASADAHREDVIENYRKQLDELALKIKHSEHILDNLKNDTEGIHAARMAEYGRRQEILNNQQSEVRISQKKADDSHTELVQRQKKMNEDYETQLKNLKDQKTSLLAKEDQLDAERKGLDKYAEIQIATRDAQAQTHKEHIKRKEDLDAATISVNKSIDEITAAQQQLVFDQAEHQKQIDEHAQLVEHHNVEYRKIMDFHEALKAREAQLDPLKQKYENGLEANQKEAQRLMDDKLESYRMKDAADKRIKMATDAEDRALDTINRLIVLKKDIHEQRK